MSTSNVSHDIAIIHYGWEDFIPFKNEIKEPKLIQEGLTYASFSRSKGIGNILNLTFTGVLPDIYVGDWIVLKTSSRGRFSEYENSKDYYLNKGIVRFIGQIYNVNSQYTADSDGILRKTFNIGVREWSHCLNIPVRYSDELRLLGISEDVRTEVIQENVDSVKLENPKVKEFVDSEWTRYIKTHKPAFEIIENLLNIIGIKSYIFSEGREATGAYLTTSILPSIPSEIYDDHIFEMPEEKYEKSFPFSSGFLKAFIGPQKWDLEISENNLFYAEDLDKIIDQEATRPVTFISPEIYSKGSPFVELVRSILDSGGEYEIYSDIFYMESEESTGPLCKPVLMIRDKPISFKCLDNSPNMPDYKKSQKNFGFTYKDSLPRINIPLNHVISLNVSYTSQETFNYIQFNPVAKAFIEEHNKRIGLKEGRFKDLESQQRFGGQEYVADIGEFLCAIKAEPPEGPPAPKITTPKDKNNKEEKAGTQAEATVPEPLSIDWFRALTQKYRYYLPIKMAMPKATIQIIDNDFPFTVGLMARIDLGAGRPTICGEIEEISYTTNINGEGKISNTTYLKLSDLLMENPENTNELIIIPKQFSQTLFIDTNKPNTEHLTFITIEK